MDRFPLRHLGRRRALAFLGEPGAGALLLKNTSQAPVTVDAASCVLSTPQVTEGPYWVDEKLFRSDLRTDPSTGVARAGTPLTFTIAVQNSSSAGCAPLAGALVDVWHCDAVGIYSDEPSYNPGGGTGTVVTTGQKFLRGYQVTDDNGQVTFTTIYPGWYMGRTIHVHVRVRTYSGTTLLDNFVTQIFFDDSISNVVLSNSTYKRTPGRDTFNTNDMVYTGAANPGRMLMPLVASGSGYSGSITLGVTMKTATTAAPSVASGGVANAASGVAGVTPGSWISIFGTNRASATRTLQSSDIVSNVLPTVLAGVSVQIDGKAAYLYYVSPTQINALSPADANLGSVAVTVTNSAGTSSASTTNLQSILPGLFALSNYVRAVRPSDGAIINGTGNAEPGFTVSTAARAGDVLELFGTGFGSTSPSVDPSQLFSAAYPTTTAVTVTIGGFNAPVSFAGLVGPGLYQLNVTVPAGLGAGDQKIVATVNGVSSPSSALLKIASV